jgi:arsenite-transporting ATPase
VRPVQGVPRLAALEIDAQAALAGCRSRFGAELRDLLLTATYLDAEDAALLLDLELPGLDELMGLGQIFDLLSATPPRFQHLVWDSAPTGHTLRLLELPGLLDHWVRVLARIVWKYRDLLGAALPGGDPGGEDDLLLTIKRTVHHFGRVVRDPAASRLVPVTVPEPMAGAETRRLLTRLRSLSVPVARVIVNGIHQPQPGCTYCRTRYRQHQDYVAQLAELLAPLRLSALYAQPVPVVGIDRLRALANIPAAPG